MPVQYTKIHETPDVFHVVKECQARRRILGWNRRKRLRSRALCDECLDLLRHGSKPMPPK